jgi:hypothetical protein
MLIEKAAHNNDQRKYAPYFLRYSRQRGIKGKRGEKRAVIVDG